MRPSIFSRLRTVVACVGVLALAPTANVAVGQTGPTCTRTISADVVALDQGFFWNRFGAAQPQGMIFALLEDIVPLQGTVLSAGNVRLRTGKRTRPLVLRMNVGDCLQINFQNFLSPAVVNQNQPSTRTASAHVSGLQLVNSIADDASNVGVNTSGLVAPGGSATYTYYADHEGPSLLSSTAVNVGGAGGGSLNAGLFGAVNVQAAGAEWYRSQVSRADIDLATIGTTPGGHPLLDYDAIYPAGHLLAGRPIFKMLSSSLRIRHSDLNAIITGPGRGDFPPGTYPVNPVYPNRDQSFREFTIIYHDELEATQAFAEFINPVLKHTLQSVRDAFAINYGTGGIGAEILANRKSVGPVHDCTDCKYEEFFLSSWSVGDPAMIVDIPANSGGGPGPMATMAMYPDDPSNVHHSYIGDHVKQRILHGGATEHHVHHLHAHQWLYSADSDESAYLDSQAIGPGGSFTLEIAYNGSGNRNQTVGDSIFHCHFYPHFAQGMWSLWRTHDVFESGTALDVNGRPATGSRALPDGEIAVGTPIPGVVPIPRHVMPPMPAAQAEIVQVAGQPGGQVQVTGTGNPGFPFFVPGVSGHRPPHPPMDTIVDGGLPRHVVTGGTASHVETRLDFSKGLLTLEVIELPEAGTAIEVAAMDYHALRLHPSYTTDGTAGNFVLNGLPASPGAPYADPCIDNLGNSVGTSRVYKATDVQIDAVLNKAGWHFPQTRLITLQEDVAATLSGAKAPEPLFFRANTDDCIQFELTNLVPNVYEMDDFQVRTPTDILGQHIHLVKFDVTSSDGSGNGWNYEDGSFSPDEVRERIAAIRVQNSCIVGDLRDGTIACPIAEPHPFFGSGTSGEWLGAQTTVQRWYADDVLNNVGQDRTLRTVFTHDHFGPSTHQQAGLYAGLVVEPKFSTWRDSETGVALGTRADGGPTSFRADVLTVDPVDSYREFMLEFADFQLAYQAGGTGFPDPDRAIGATAIDAADVCPGGVSPPCPEAVSDAGKGTMSVNYRNEPMGQIIPGSVLGTTRTIEGRLIDPVAGAIALGDAGDVSHYYRSILRADPAFNVQPTTYPPLTADVQPTDPYTPMLRAYENDNVQVRVMVGAHAELHNFSMHGVNWLFEPSDSNSGYRNSQVMGISEHFEFVFTVPPSDGPEASTDYLYLPGASTVDQKQGLWGIMRAYDGDAALRMDLVTLPNNPTGSAPLTNPLDFNGVCPVTAPLRQYNVTAVSAAQAIPGGTLVYNARTDTGGQIHDPAALLYVRSEDLDMTGVLLPGVPVEPLILRAAAGDCIEVTLTNAFDVAAVPFVGAQAASTVVGLHPQLVAMETLTDDGANVGINPVQTVLPGASRTYRWYAGNVVVNTDGSRQGIPVEFGATNLMPSDVTEQVAKGLVGAMIIEPAGSTWIEDATSRASATVTRADTTSFREFVVIFQDDIVVEPDLTFGPKPFTSAINYRSEPLWKRFPFNPDTTTSQQVGALDLTNFLSNAQIGGADPETPIFMAAVGDDVRFRVLNPGGSVEHVFELHGHSWQDQPYTNNSTVIGDNPQSDHRGARVGHGPGSHFDAVLENGAGGAFGVPGDYVYRNGVASGLESGSWGILRVACTTNADCDDSLFCNGSEVCIASACVAGTPIDCDDGIPCSVDTCDDATMLCVHTADDALCDDGVACNGAETCDVAAGCVSGGMTCPGLVTTSLSAGRTPVDLTNSIAGFVGIGIPDITNVTFSGAGTAAGTFNGGSGVIGPIESGIVLSTGNIASVTGPNTSDNRTTNQGTAGDSDLDLLIPGTTSDASVLEFDFACPGAPGGSVITMTYVFTSDTYNELVGTGSGPAFGVFLNGQNVAVLPDLTTQMSIEAINCGNPFDPPLGGSNCGMFINNDCTDIGPGTFPCAGNRDTEMDGITVPLSIFVPVPAGNSHMKIAIGDGSTLMADSAVFILAGSLECVRINEPPLPSSLKTIPVPEPDNLLDYVKNKDAAIRLGKAFFWDMQAGSDGIQACASCHFSAGADARIRNTLNPGANGVANVGGPNYTLQPTDFPFASAPQPLDADDVVGSQGVVRRDFTGIVPGGVVDDGVSVLDPYHQVSGLNTRRVTGRNSPSVINSVFNVRNFWDGRANFVFNGVSPFGARDPNNPQVLEVQPGGAVLPVSVILEKSSLASQAVGPANNGVEMAWNGRTFPELGQKLLSLQPLARQVVDPTDSVLGSIANTVGGGLTTTYETMIQEAFHDKYWSDTQLTAQGFSQLESNFALFWGLAIQTYETTLVSDDAPFDRFREGDANALTLQQQRGLELFVDPFTGLCALCHIGSEFSGATQFATLLVGRFEQEILEPMIMGDGVAAVYDTGFYNIGVRPTNDDLGNGGLDPFGAPISFARLAQQGVDIGPPFTFTPFVDPLQRLAVNGSFKTPILRNVELTGPYMHNGGMDTLEQVVEFYTRGGDFPDVNIDDLAPLITVLPLTALDRAAIVSFLKSLTDERVRMNAAPFDHPQLFVAHGHVGDDVSVVSNGQGEAADCLIEIPAVGAAGAAPVPLSTACMLACGNGLLEAGEACDDGNTLDGDCCSSTCQLAPVGAPCPSADCTASVCDVGGNCVFSANVSGPCADGLPCSSGGMCQAGVCQPGPGLCVDTCEQCNVTTDSCDRCVFDENVNGVMDGLDFAFFSGCFGGCYSPIDPCVRANYDQDVNNCVGGGDFAAFSGCFGKTCGECGLCFPSAGGAVSSVASAMGPNVSVVLLPVAIASPEGFADELPTPSQSFRPGQRFELEVWASLVDGFGDGGLASVYVDVNYDSALLVAETVDVADAFSTFSRGATDASGAVVETVGGCATVGDGTLGVEFRWVRVATVHMRAVEAGRATMSLRPSQAPFGVSLYGRFGDLPQSQLSYRAAIVDVNVERAVDDPARPVMGKRSRGSSRNLGSTGE